MIKNIGRIVRSLRPPAKHSHKGQNGKLLVIGGSKQYHGAPVFSLLAARRFVDLLYFYPAERDPYLLRAVKQIPEAIVVYKLDKTHDVDCVLFGIGLGKAKLDVRKLGGAKRLVIDGDGLKLIMGRMELAKGAILTPHELEFRRVFGLNGTKDNVIAMAKRWKCIILKKDPHGDIVSDGKQTKVIAGGNPGMTKGGTGDVLAGLVAALHCKNSAFESAVAGAYINRKAGESLKKKFGLNYCASDLANELAKTVKRLSL